MKGLKTNCDKCGKEFTKKRNGHKYCRTSCRTMHNREKKGIEDPFNKTFPTLQETKLKIIADFMFLLNNLDEYQTVIMSVEKQKNKHFIKVDKELHKSNENGDIEGKRKNETHYFKLI